MLQHDPCRIASAFGHWLQINGDVMRHAIKDVQSTDQAGSFLGRVRVSKQKAVLWMHMPGYRWPYARNISLSNNIILTASQW